MTRPITREVAAQVIEMAPTSSSAEIAVHLGLNVFTLRNWLSKHGVKVAKRSRTVLPLSNTPAARTCQWLHGEPGDRNFCGKPTLRGKSWCAEHAAIVFEKPDEDIEALL